MKLIAGRRTGDLEPLTPSRLLFACDDRTVADRIPRFFPETPQHVDTRQAERLLPAATSSRFEIPRPAALPKPINSMRVTSFKDYLACPYRFYLKHVLGLEAVEPADELDPLSFGSLAHDVLKRFGREAIKDSTDPAAIREFLHAQLAQLVAKRFGDDAVPAVKVQVEQLRRRLDGFASWQAKWRADGWRVEHTELEVSGEQAAMVVDGEPMYLRGRIDRIDRHERTGEWCVLDYKTSEAGEDLKKAHGRDGQWHDLQLPLYRHLVRAAGIADDMKLGTIALPREPNSVGVQAADWTAEDLHAADDAARDVIRSVRRGDFAGPTESPPPGSDAYAWICQEGRTTPRLEDEGEEAGS